MGTGTKGQLAPIERLAIFARDAGLPKDSLERFLASGYVPQARQVVFHAAARACDQQDGPTEVGFGGARGGGKSVATFAQVALDDCQRVPGLKFLFLRRVGKAARESFEDLCLKVAPGLTPGYKRQLGILELANGSRIVLGHFQSEKDIDNYLGIEYDGAVIEEATQLSASKYQQIKTCIRTSKPNWRPRIYLTTNPGGLGHAWFKARFIDPFRRGIETATRFVAATFRDNAFLNTEYKVTLDSLTGWLRGAWRDGDWDIAAGQYFSTWRHEAHVCAPFPIPYHWPVWAALDYGFTHPTACYLFTENDGMVYVVAEHVAAKQLPPQHADEIKAMLGRYGVDISRLDLFAAGGDVFENKGDAGGKTIASQYAECGVDLTRAVMDRPNGWGEVLKRLGDIDRGIAPTLKIFNNCVRLIECLPALQHDPHRPEDVLKINVDEDGAGGDDTADALRYGLMARQAYGLVERQAMNAFRFR